MLKKNLLISHFAEYKSIVFLGDELHFVPRDTHHDNFYDIGFCAEAVSAVRVTSPQGCEADQKDDQQGEGHHGDPQGGQSSHTEPVVHHVEADSQFKELEPVIAGEERGWWDR